MVTCLAQLVTIEYFNYILTECLFIFYFILLNLQKPGYGNHKKGIYHTKAERKWK